MERAQIIARRFRPGVAREAVEMETHKNARKHPMNRQTHIQSPLIRETRYEAARREDERQRRIFLLIALPGSIAAVAFLVYTATR